MVDNTHIEKDHVDKNGIPRRMLVPDEYTDPAKGIRVSVYLDERLRELGWNKEQIKRLYQELWKRGIIYPRDVYAAHNANAIRAALNAVLQVDVQVLQSIAKEQKANG